VLGQAGPVGPLFLISEVTLCGEARFARAELGQAVERERGREGEREEGARETGRDVRWAHRVPGQRDGHRCLRVQVSLTEPSGRGVSCCTPPPGGGWVRSGHGDIFQAHVSRNSLDMGLRHGLVERIVENTVNCEAGRSPGSPGSQTSFTHRQKWPGVLAEGLERGVPSEAPAPGPTSPGINTPEIPAGRACLPKAAGPLSSE